MLANNVDITYKVFHGFFMVFHGFSWFFHGFFKELDFKELDFKELEIHRYSLLDTINEYQWISINEYQWISINEFIDGSLMVPFLWFPFFGPSLGPVGPPLGPVQDLSDTRHCPPPPP